MRFTTGTRGHVAGPRLDTPDPAGLAGFYPLPHDGGGRQPATDIYLAVGTMRRLMGEKAHPSLCRPDPTS